ncbi:efflux RND transporter periplasmic adaptor subunit [Chloroflexota bacterium]
MKKLNIVGMLLLCLIMVSTTAIACNPFGENEQDTEMQLTEAVKGDLNITVSGSGNTELSNDITLKFGTAGRIDKLYAEENDVITKGEILAELEIDAFELTVTQAEVAYTQAKVTVTQAELGVQTAQYNLDKAEDLYEWPELSVAYADVEIAKNSVRSTQDKLNAAMESNPTGDHSALISLLAHAQANLLQYEAKLNAMLSGDDTEEVAMKRKQLEIAQESLELSNESLALSEQSLEQAQNQLDKTVIIAPFDGAIASVFVEEKDTVSTASPIFYLIDTTSMELKVQLDEIDVPDLELGQKCIIEVDALPALPLEGNLTSISLLPQFEGGVIVYNVTIQFDVPEDSGLRAGMSATADIVTTERNNIIIVPERAIKQDSQGNPIVEVMIGEQIEERTVTLGLSDGFQTEIIDGITEGEVIVEKR